jgi:hypothetical protein
VTPAVPRCCSINLQYGNSSERGSYNIDNNFRRELEEIADMLRLETSVCLHVDAIGRPYASPRETTARFTVTRSPSPKDSTAPLHPRCRPGGGERLSHGSVVDFPAEQSGHTAVTSGPGSSRVLIAGCPEGVGRHGLYPFLDRGPEARLRHLYRHLLVHPRQVPKAAVSKAARLLQPTSSRPLSRPIWLYTQNAALSTRSSRPFRVTDSWDVILGRI